LLTDAELNSVSGGVHADGKREKTPEEKKEDSPK
jgi:hypothetical protein